MKERISNNKKEDNNESKQKKEAKTKTSKDKQIPNKKTGYQETERKISE